MYKALPFFRQLSWYINISLHIVLSEKESQRHTLSAWILPLPFVLCGACKTPTTHLPNHKYDCILLSWTMYMCFVLTRTVKMQCRPVPASLPNVCTFWQPRPPGLLRSGESGREKRAMHAFVPFASFSHHLQSVAGRKCNGSVCQNTIAFFQRRREFWSPMRAGSLDKQLLSLVIDTTRLLGSPIESCSPPLNAHQMPYRVEWTWKQGGEEQLQIRAGYTRSCSCSIAPNALVYVKWSMSLFKPTEYISWKPILVSHIPGSHTLPPPWQAD